MIPNGVSRGLGSNNEKWLVCQLIQLLMILEKTLNYCSFVVLFFFFFSLDLKSIIWEKVNKIMKLDNKHIIIYSYAINIAFFSFNWSSCWRTNSMDRLTAVYLKWTNICFNYHYLLIFICLSTKKKQMFTMCMELQIMLIIKML